MSDNPVPDDPLACLLGYHVRRLSVLLMADLQEALAPLDLKVAEASVLLAIGAIPGATQSAVGRYLGIERANMAPLIGRLVARGLVEREDLDGRSQAMSLTSDGRRLRTRARAAMDAHEQRCFANLGEGERLRLARELNSLWVGLEKK